MKTLQLNPKSSLYEQTFTVLSTCKLFEFVLPELIIGDPEFSLISYSSGDSIYNRNDFERSLGIIIKGSALICKDSPNKSVIMREITKADTFGAAALFGTSEHYASDIKAKGKETVVAYIPQTLMKRLMENDFRTAQRYIEFLSDRIRYLNEKLDLYTSASAYDKVLSYLRHNSGDAPINMQKLSKQLDIGRATLYRTLDKLCADGVIKREGKNVVIIKDER